jgi:hypothetical protein
MVVALFALAAAMFFGGLTAVVQGYDIVLLERGWTLVIAGSVCATGGALLAGLAVAVARLGRIRNELVHLREGTDRIAALLPADGILPADGAFGTAAAFAAGAEASEAFEAQGEADERAEPELPPFMRPDRTGHGDAAGPAPDLDDTIEQERDAPRGSRLFRPRGLFRRPDDATAEPEDARAALVAPEPRFGAVENDLRLGEREEEPERDAPQPDIEKTLAARLGLIFGRRREAEEPDPDRENEDLPTRETPAPLRDDLLGPQPDPELDAVPDPDLVRGSGEEKVDEVAVVTPVRMEPDRSVEGAPADVSSEDITVVGTYDSGNNHYVMYSDGSIEAETPEGKFRFESLDELKAFIAGGGEAGARSAP